MKSGIPPHNYRSKFERQVAAWLTQRGIQFKYEPRPLVYYQEIPNGICPKCGLTCIKRRMYLPDFVIVRKGPPLFLESKGKLDSLQRTKFLALKTSTKHDIRLVFMRDNKIHKFSKTHYMEWAAQHKIKACVFPHIPLSWFAGKKNGH